MTGILEIDPVDFAGAIGHMAANGLYAILEGRELENENWFGGDFAQTEQDVYELATYVAQTDAAGERLWRFAAIEKLTADDDYHDIALSRRLAFNLFASTSLQAMRELTGAQAAAAAVLTDATVETVMSALKVEDSIFEPHGNLGDQEAYQEQWLADQQAVDRQSIEDAVKEKEAEWAVQATSAGSPIEPENQTPPATLSAGKQEGASDEKETADQGQDLVGQAQPDPDAQGSISELVGEGYSAEGSDQPLGEDTPASEVAEPLADQGSDKGGQSADQAGADQASISIGTEGRDAVSGQEPGDTGSEPGDAGAGADHATTSTDGDSAGGAEVKKPVKATQAEKTKSQN